MNEEVAQCLERLKAMVVSHLTEEFIVELSHLEDVARKAVSLRAKFSLFGLLDSVEEVPLDWWQAVRRRWAPRWWLRRYPVQTRRIKLYQAVYFKPTDDPLFGHRIPHLPDPEA